MTEQTTGEGIDVQGLLERTNVSRMWEYENDDNEVEEYFCVRIVGV